jgi:ribonuclease HI
MLNCRAILRTSTQLWRLNPNAAFAAATLQQESELPPEAVKNLLTSCGNQRFAFHWYERSPPPRLLLYRQHQQDSLRHSWDGLIAGTDGSVDERAERMGAGYVLGVDPEPILILSTREEGPLASARAEAASLLQLLRDVQPHNGSRVHLLIFVDCLVALDILCKWGHDDFTPGPKKVLHFDVIRQLLQELRQWLGNVTLVKIKSHTGCLMNEQADEQAEQGRMAEGTATCPGPQKYGSFWLRVRPAVREIADSSSKTLPRDSAPNCSLLEKTASRVLQYPESRQEA